MKTDAEFLQYYNSVLKKKIIDIEPDRIQAAAKYRSFNLGAVLVIIISILLCWVHLGFLIIIFIEVLYGKLLFELINDWVKVPYNTKFKKVVLSSMAQFYHPKLKHIPLKGIHQQAVIISQIFRSKSWNRSKSEDYVEGRIGRTYLQFSELRLSLTPVLNLYNLISKNRFSGLFAIATFNKHFKGQYIIVPDKFTGLVGRTFGDQIQSINMSRPPLIKTESSEFEKEFTVFGTDEIEARYILSPALMARMLDFKTKVNKNVYFSFARGRMFVAISVKHDLFEPDLNDIVKYQQLLLWHTNMNFVVGLVEDLNLNTWIWSKK